MADSAQEHLVNHLRDIHAIELQALRQLARAVQVSRDDDDAKTIYSEHLEETEQHEQRVAELIEGQGLAPSPVEDKTMRGGVIGLRQLSDVPLNSPVRVAMHLFALEHLELAAYELLAEIARANNDEELAEAAEKIAGQVREAATKIEGTFDGAARLEIEQHEQRAESDDKEQADKSRLLLDQLIEVHALEEQSRHLLQVVTEELCEDEELKRLYGEHLEQTREHERRVSERIEGHDAKPSAVRDLHLGAASVGLRDLAGHPPDTAVKLAMNFFCFEHLEVAAYELLARLANETGDGEAADLAQTIVEQERQFTEALKNSFGHCVELMLASDASYEGTRPLDAAHDR